MVMFFLLVSGKESERRRYRGGGERHTHTDVKRRKEEGQEGERERAREGAVRESVCHAHTETERGREGHDPIPQTHRRPNSNP